MALTLDGTNESTLPTWTTAGRPANSQAGQMGLNTTLGYIEWYSTVVSNWIPIYSPATYSIDYLVVAGGGGRYGGGGDGKDNIISGTGRAGNGGSGIVIIRYLGSQRGTGGTVTSRGGYTYHTFTTSGTFTA